MNAIDRQYMKTPFYGARKMTLAMREQGFSVNHKKTERLMREMGIHAIYAGPKMSIPGKNHTIYPYLLRDVSITAANQVWSTDLTYIPMQQGFMYCVAVMDWFSRYVLAWGISNTKDGEFCVNVLAEALRKGTPVIFNTDQGSEFTSDKFTKCLLDAKIQISMDGRGRALDNVFVERLWRSLKYEDVYLHNYLTPYALYEGLGSYFDFYNNERYHESLDYRKPAEIYFASTNPRKDVTLTAAS
jgi:putative transposase